MVTQFVLNTSKETIIFNVLNVKINHKPIDDEGFRINSKLILSNFRANWSIIENNQVKNNRIKFKIRFNQRRRS